MNVVSVTSVCRDLLISRETSKYRIVRSRNAG